MMQQTAAACLACLLVLSGCNMNGMTEERPALIVNPTDASRAELRRAVSEMLSGADITLADDALTTSSVLLIERKRIRSLDNPPLSGRDLSRPERFRLVTARGRCILVHDRDQARFELQESDCVAE